MTVLEWDKIGDRRYETGVDRGVLFLPDGPAVPWNGLTSVTETLSREVKSYYVDGTKFMDHHVPGSYSAKLAAFTYPDELETLLGMTEYAPGVFLHDQRTKLFHLSYRTLIGNDVDGTDHGYKVHVVYNILAIPSDKTMNSLSNQVSVEPFEWDLSGTPNVMFGSARRRIFPWIRARSVLPCWRSWKVCSTERRMSMTIIQERIRVCPGLSTFWPW
jgi:hypothetical protein